MPAFRGYISDGTFEVDPVVSRRRVKSLENVRCITDEEKHAASLCDEEECQGTRKLS